MKWISQILKKKRPILKVQIFKGQIYSIQSQYESLLKWDIEIISTTLTKDYTSYGYTETFVLMVTYKQF